MENKHVGIWIQEGDELLRTRRFAEAAERYERAAAAHEVPPGAVCAKLARAIAGDGRAAEASGWALRAVDAGDDFASWSAAAKVLQRGGPDSIPRVRRTARVALVGTWTTSAFTPLFQLAAARMGIACEIYEAPFDQYYVETLDPGSPLFLWKPDVVLLCPEYRSLGLPAFAEDPESVVEAEVERWSSVWKAIRKACPLTIIQHGFALPGLDTFGHLGASLEGSRSSMRVEVNRRLALRAGREDIGFVQVDALAARHGKDAWFDDRNWFLAKVAYSVTALPLLARHTAAVLAARLGLSRRCLVLDLDNTLWGGVVGDDGVAELTLADGPDGEAYVVFQRMLKELAERGIILAVCSKNEDETAKMAFLSHPEMVLKLDDFSAFVANWRPKSENLREIASRLNLGLESLVFVDDNPYERAEVRRSLPDVDVLALPDEPIGFCHALRSYPLLEPATFSAEDRGRSEQYRARAMADEIRQEAGSLEEYQAQLGMVAMIGSIDPVNMARVVQLINKTNQFNLTTRRRDRAAVKCLLEQPGVEHFWIRLRDRFADHGLIAVVIARIEGTAMEIDTLLMSCRVIGRGLEFMIGEELASRARLAGCDRIVGEYSPTPRNALVADLLPGLGFDQPEPRPDGSTVWTLDVTREIRRNFIIEVERP